MREDSLRGDWLAAWKRPAVSTVGPRLPQADDCLDGPNTAATRRKPLSSAVAEKSTAYVVYRHAARNIPERTLRAAARSGWKHTGRTKDRACYLDYFARRLKPTEHVQDWYQWAERHGFEGPFYGTGHVLMPHGSGTDTTAAKRKSQRRKDVKENLHHWLPAELVGCFSGIPLDGENLDDTCPVDWPFTGAAWLRICQHWRLFGRAYNFAVNTVLMAQQSGNVQAMHAGLAALEALEKHAGQWFTGPADTAYRGPINGNFVGLMPTMFGDGYGI